MTTAFYAANKDDYLGFDNIETVTLTLSNGDTVSNVACLFQSQPIRQVLGGGGGEGEFAAFPNGAVALLFTSSMGGSEPDEGTNIVFGNGDSWRVSRQPFQMSERMHWRCVIVKDRA